MPSLFTFRCMCYCIQKGILFYEGTIRNKNKSSPTTPRAIAYKNTSAFVGFKWNEEVTFQNARITK